KVTKKWLADHNVPIFPHPPISPDVSAIEPVWHILKTHLRDYQPPPSTESQLRDVPLDIWGKITCDEINPFIERTSFFTRAFVTELAVHCGF
ncbi:hypothetical protein C8F04DRAFT_926571, partial [Mycena alexandri]